MTSGPALELAGACKRYGSTQALVDVSFRVAPGACTALVGPNGAGKTTSFALLCGWLHPTAGTVRVLGGDPLVPGHLKRRLGVLPQDAALPAGLSVGPLLGHWARLSGLERPETEARVALEYVGLSELWEANPTTLSHGMSKRVALAQALMGTPEVVLLDEPTAGLDPRIAAEVRGLIRGMRGRQTVLVSSHNLAELETLCDEVVILDHGRLVQAGSMAQLTERSAEFRVTLAHGDVPLAELRALPGVAEARLDPSGALEVRLQPGAAPEALIGAVLERLLAAGVAVTGVTQGRSLEQRVLSVTGDPRGPF